jgi:hypothetical protein
MPTAEPNRRIAGGAVTMTRAPRQTPFADVTVTPFASCSIRDTGAPSTTADTSAVARAHDIYSSGSHCELQRAPKNENIRRTNKRKYLIRKGVTHDGDSGR